VHFPVACWTLGTVADFASLRFDARAWQWAGPLLAVGTLMAIPAALTGFLELVRIPKGSDALRDANYHMIAMTVALTFYALSVILRVDHMQFTAPGTVGIVLDFGGLLFLAIGGWLGGKLVYGHGVGVNLTSVGHAGGDPTRHTARADDPDA